MTFEFGGFKLSKTKSATLLMSVFLVAFVAGCKKKVPIASAPPPPPPTTTTTTTTTETAKAPVVAQFTAEPSSIERGQSSTLRWSVSDATSVAIEPGLGPVQSNGSRQVFPSNTTTYRLVASGPSGNANATATVPLIVPYTMFEDRLSQVDLRLMKGVKVGRARVQGMFDIYNVTNSSTVLSIVTSYPTNFLNPASILGARLFKFGAQVDF